MLQKQHHKEALVKNLYPVNTKTPEKGIITSFRSRKQTTYFYQQSNF